MAYDTGSPLGFFFGNDSSDPRVNQQLRQRIALAMMAQKRAYPKNVGEGLSAIGDAIAERKMMQSLLQGDLAQQAVMPPAALSETSEAPAAQRTAYAPTEDVSGASATPPIVAATPQAAVQPPPPLETAPSQPASMLASQMPTGVQGVDATPLSQAMNPQPMLPPQARVPSPMEPVDPNQRNALDENIDPRFGRRRAIAGIESGGTRDPYATLGAVTRTGDRAYGKYQMMGANIPSWTQAALGRSLTPQQFLASRDAQDTTFDKTFGGYADKYGEEGAAKAWYAGEGGMNNPNATDQHGRLTVRGYGQDFVNRLNGGQASPRDAITAQLLARGGDDTAPAVPQPNLMPTGGQAPDQRLALNGTPSPNVVPDIRPAPPVPSGIRAAPPTQVAQAQPQAIPGFVPPPPGAPQGVPIIKMSPREAELTNWLNAEKARGNPYAEAKANAAGLQDLQNERITRQNAANEMYKAQIARDTEQFKLNLTGRMDQSKRIQDLAEQQQKLIGGGTAVPAVDPRVLGTPQSPQRTGIPTVPPVPPGITPQQWAEKQAPEMVKAVSAVEKATPQFKQMMDLIQQAENHPGKEWGVGPLSSVTGHLPSAVGFKKIMEQIGGQNFLNVYQQLKGGGSITEIEGSKAEAAQARLSTAQNKEDFNKAMDDFKNAIRQDLETVQRKVNQPVTAWQRSPNDEPAPDIGQIGVRKGKPSQYIGGNPAVDSSYRDVR